MFLRELSATSDGLPKEVEYPVEQLSGGVRYSLDTVSRQLSHKKKTRRFFAVPVKNFNFT
jgi:hypothetical protein